MNSPKKTALFVSLVMGLCLAGCGGSSDQGSDNVGSGNSAKQDSPAGQGGNAAAGANQVLLGEVLTMPSAEITMVSFDKVDVLERENGDSLVPEAGESLWLMEMDFTNTSDQEIDRQCLGPTSINIRAFDSEGGEMLEDANDWYIAQNICDKSVPSGQPGVKFMVFRGSEESVPGGLVFRDFSEFSEPGVVALAPGFTQPPGS